MKTRNPRPNTSAETDQSTARLSAQKSAGTRTVLSAESFIEAAKAPATKQGYANDVRDFVNRGGEIPATPDQVMNYLAQIAAELAVATIERRLIAIHKSHIDQGHVSPVSHPMVKRTMRGIRRTLGTRQRQTRAIIKEDLIEITMRIDQRRGRHQPMRAARDKAYCWWDLPVHSGDLNLLEFALGILPNTVRAGKFCCDAQKLTKKWRDEPCSFPTPMASAAR